MAEPSEQTFSHYRILSKIGDEGMSVAYEADDQKLGRHRAFACSIIPMTRTVGQIFRARPENHQGW